MDKVEQKILNFKVTQHIQLNVIFTDTKIGEMVLKAMPDWWIYIICECSYVICV